MLNRKPVASDWTHADLLQRNQAALFNRLKALSALHGSSCRMSVASPVVPSSFPRQSKNCTKTIRSLSLGWLTLTTSWVHEARRSPMIANVTWGRAVVGRIMASCVDSAIVFPDTTLFWFRGLVSGKTAGTIRAFRCYIDVFFFTL